MRITYGVNGNTRDVTEICYTSLIKDSILTIPSGDGVRAGLFSDPVPGVLKKIFIHDCHGSSEYDHQTVIKINVDTDSIVCISNQKTEIELIEYNIHTIHSKLKINHGSLIHELPEQKMVVQYLSGKEKVLEIGGNIGRNSLVIASILSNGNGGEKNLVVLESDPVVSLQLCENRDLNNFQFHIEDSALSKRKLIQQGWSTKESDGNTIPEGWTSIKTITLEELKTKYNIKFDTLVLDCEGAFYYILQDMPEILEGINLIIMENDYEDFAHKIYIDGVLRMRGFRVDYSEGGGWGPCAGNFYEVWKR